jgi:hypothetical protein
MFLVSIAALYPLRIVSQKSFVIQALSKILWAFDLSTPDGNPIDISLETGFEGSTMRQPLPFALECRVRRDAEGGCQRQEMIDREMESATEWFAGL